MNDYSLGQNLFAVVVDEANYAPPALPVGTPVSHRDRPEVVGVIEGSYWEKSKLWYVVEWIVEGFAPQVRSTWVRELPTEMHLLAYASI